MSSFDHSAALAAIGEAPLSGDWTCAMRHFADAGGGWGTQLVGISPSGALLFDHFYEIPKDVIEEFEARCGIDPALNPRALVLRRSDAVAYGDDDLMPEAERLRNPFYAEFYGPAGGPHACLSKVTLAGGSVVGAVAVRSASAGPVSEQQKRQVEALMPHIKAAAHLQAELEEKGVAIALGAYEPLDFPIFLLGQAGQVLAQTAAADSFLRTDRFLRLSRKRLVATDTHVDVRLQAVIAQVVSRPGESPLRQPSSVLLRHDEELLMAEAAPLPAASVMSLRLGAVAILTIPRWRSSAPDPEGVLREAFSLSPGEAAVAILVGQGASLSEVAVRRNVSPLTVRTQLKAVFRKTGAASQATLTRIVNSLK